MSQRKNKGKGAPSTDTVASPVPNDDSTSTDAVHKTGLKGDNMLQSVRDRVKDLYEVVDPINLRFRFRSRPSTAEIFSKPLVVCLGNHSSGKSTFINHVLKTSAGAGTFQEIQKTGVAPLDDGFTFITYGENNDEQQGPAIVSNTNLPFASLSKFGNQFVNHLRLKLCPIPLLRDVILVDSPGMIDSATEGSDRGYDFLKAVRWFAERADFVMIFFDPDKPGTTGESLEVFTKALNGIDHKLLILFNKVDKFQNISDFSRAYGALCWNLAKVIPFKDIPYIYTTYVPTGASEPERSWSLNEFAASRREVIDKITHAPSRHMDNLLTELQRYGEQLLIHAKVLSAARSQLWWYRLQLWAILVLIVAAVCAVVFRFASHDVAFWAAPVVVFVLGALLVVRAVSARDKYIIANLNESFERAHAVELTWSKDQREELERTWEVVKPSAVSVAERFGLLSFSSLKRADIDKLNTITRQTVPDLLTRVHKTLIRA